MIPALFSHSESGCCGKPDQTVCSRVGNSALRIKKKTRDLWEKDVTFFKKDVTI